MLEFYANFKRSSSTNINMPVIYHRTDAKLASDVFTSSKITTLDELNFVPDLVDLKERINYIFLCL